MILTEGLIKIRNGGKNMKNNKYQTIDITASLDVVDNSFAYKTKEDIDHLCVVLKNQAKEGADIQGFIYVNRNILKAKNKNLKRDKL
jgi:hypothetical protein|tara:strand:- start:294 stop:554 length:261 start_codon:yes stop_codon:yes gene_type:complete